MRLLLWFTPLLAGCFGDPQEVTIKGTVWTSHTQNSPLEDTQIEVLDVSGNRYARTSTNQKGAFSVGAPWGSEVYAVLRKDGHVTTSFSGVTGTEEVLKLQGGEFHGLPQEEWDLWLTRYGGCDGVGTGGALIGEARFAEIRDTESGEYPLVETLSVQVEGSDGRIYRGCYLDDTGETYAPEATETGPSGEFAVLGLPEGEAWIDLEYLFIEVDGERYTYEVSYRAWVPGEGVLPRFPFWLEVLL